MSYGQRQIAVFDSDAFSREWQDSNGEHVWGQDCALYLRKEIESTAGWSVDAAVSLEDDGWAFDARLGPASYGLFVHWAPIGSPPRDLWVVQLYRKVGFIKEILKSKERDEVEELAGVVDHILSNDERIRDLRWYTFDEFRKIY
jgi:hypothetical protein